MLIINKTKIITKTNQQTKKLVPIGLAIFKQVHFIFSDHHCNLTPGNLYLTLDGCEYTKVPKVLAYLIT